MTKSLKAFFLCVKDFRDQELFVGLCLKMPVVSTVVSLDGWNFNLYWSAHVIFILNLKCKYCVLIIWSLPLLYSKQPLKEISHCLPWMLRLLSSYDGYYKFQNDQIAHCKLVFFFRELTLKIISVANWSLGTCSEHQGIKYCYYLMKMYFYLHVPNCVPGNFCMSPARRMYLTAMVTCKHVALPVYSACFSVWLLFSLIFQNKVISSSNFGESHIFMCCLHFCYHGSKNTLCHMVS